MTNIKDLFKTFNAQKAYVSKSLNDLEPGVESADFTTTTLALQNETDPYVDYSKPENFVFYGSAEQYYRDAFNYIQHEYPYDGSGKEKGDWELLASGFDKYIYNHKYPRTNGFVTIGKDATGVPSPTGYWTPSRQEFIYFEGGPHPAPQIAEGASVSEYFPSSQAAIPGSNYYNEEINQQSNLEINGGTGISLEFWFRKDGYLTLIESGRQVVCDIWNNAAWGTADYGRFRVEISGATGNQMAPNFHIELLSGSTGFSSDQISNPSPTLIMSASSLTGSWNHFALTFENTDTQMTGRLFQNGELVYSIITGSTMDLISGPVVGQIGSLVTAVSGNQGARSDGLLSASLDEFRFWKTARSSQDIGLNWFAQINGGTNTDFQYAQNAPTKYSFTNPVDLGFYYKFNEGITGLTSTDSVVLDYSGRLTNGAWTGYGASPNQRIPESAIVEAGASAFEYKDPILYSFHPSVALELNELVSQGFNYDINNNASIYQSLPGWIRDDDVINNRNILLKLTQIIASYFDRLQLQIKRLPDLKDINYISSSYKPIPFADRLIDSTGITSTELFNEAKAYEQLVSRDDFRLFSEKLDATKNRIYQNIYNNLVYIFKSKGAEKSFRNLIRCYGIGNELVKFNLYGDEVTYTIRENFESTVVQKGLVNFFSSSNFNATVFQATGTVDNVNERSFISSSAHSTYQGNTFEVEAFFPKSDENTKAISTHIDFQTASLFGLHTAGLTGPDEWTWVTPDVANFQTYAIKTGWQNKDAIFMLTGTAGGAMPQLTSSVQLDVYDNKKWTFAVRVKPTKYPWSAAIEGSENTTYDVEFLGYDTTLDAIENQFKVTGTISLQAGQNFLTSSKRAFVGAHRTNFTGSVLEQTDIRVSAARYWLDYLDDKTIFAHAKDASNFGRYHPGRNTFLNQFGNNFGSEVTPIPEIETLALQWSFDQVTGSNASGEFFVDDYSSGSLSSTSSYGWLGPLVKLQHPGKGFDFPVSNPDIITQEYLYSAQQQLPDVLNSSDMVAIKSLSDQEVYTTESRPIRYFFAVEKSMNAIISSEMVKLFATVLDFNNLIGEPVNRYRQDYKAIEKLRELFFRRVKNEAMDFEKFVDYYKWIDDTIVVLLSQLFPISANFNNKIFTMIESHMLERNKIWNKFPTLEVEQDHLDAGLYGITEMLYPYERGSAPIPISQSSHCVWAHERAESETFSSGNPIIDSERNTFREANDFRPTANPPTLTDINSGTPTQYKGSTYALRNFTKIYKLKAEEMPVFRGGSNIVRIKNVEFAHVELPFGATSQLKINPSEIESDIDCNDVVDPNDKNKLRYKLTYNPISYRSGRGDIFAPFSLYDSPVNSGYASVLSGCFRPNTVLSNYHDDFYGDKEIPAQGPFTEKYVGGREYRHVPFWTPPESRPEAWNLNLNCFKNSKSFRFGERPLVNPGAAIELTDTFFENGPGGSWSVSLWRKMEPEAYDPAHVHPMISRTALNAIWWDTTDFGFLIDTNGGGYTRVGIMASTGYKEATSNEVPANLLMDGNWHLLVCGYDEPNNKMWLDIDNGTWTDENVFVGTPIVPADGDCKMSIGTYWDGTAGEYLADEQWSGSMDEIGLWKASLSDPASIAEIWNGGCPGNLMGHTQGAGLSSWYRMGDSPGDNASAGGTMVDVLGNNDGECKNTQGDEIVDEVKCLAPPFTLTARTANQPRSTLLREPLAKRPVNIRNIRQTTGSTIIGNYSHDYEIVQTSGRLLNNRFFVKNEGFDPDFASSVFIPGIAEYALPDFSLYGPTKWVFVERFNAPGGPEISSRGALDLYAEEYAIYNNLNVRNLIVRNALNKWSSTHAGQFGIHSSLQLSVSGGTTSAPIVSVIGPSEPEGFRQPRANNYDTLASYHKVNRNGAHRGLYKSDWSRETEWTKLVGVKLENFNRTLNYFYVPGAATWAGHYAESNQIIETTGYFEIEVVDILASHPWAVGISSNQFVTDGSTFWEFSWWHLGGGIIHVMEGNNNPGGAMIMSAEIGDKLRIFRDKNTIIYQHKPVNSGSPTGEFNTIWTSTLEAKGDYYPRAALPENLDADTAITNARISNPRYDNWFVQHPIPQDRLQYAWINASYDKSKDQPFGFLGSPDDGKTNFTIPTGSTNSVSSSMVQFVSASTWEFPALESLIDAQDYLVNFVNMNPFLDPNMMPPRKYKYVFSTTEHNTVEPSDGYLSAQYNIGAINTHFNNLNGPYQHPSWKQIRTGETPIARYQKKNNIITVGPPRQNTKPIKKWLARRFVVGTQPTIDSRRTLNWANDHGLKGFIEPMVSFKWRPLYTRFRSGNNFFDQNASTDPLAWSAIESTFTNNMYYCANPELSKELGVEWVQGADSFSLSRNSRPRQMHDVLYNLENWKDRFKTLIYSEVIYPREIYTGLNIIRSRVNYAEDNPTNAEGYAIASYGSNGIDRNSSKRRSFWSNEWF